MAYSRKNLLKDIIWVQETYKQYKSLGYSNRHILRTYINIEGRRQISERTYYEYLATPAVRELKKIEETEAVQMSIF